MSSRAFQRCIFCIRMTLRILNRIFSHYTVSRGRQRLVMSNGTCTFGEQLYLLSMRRFVLKPLVSAWRICTNALIGSKYLSVVEWNEDARQAKSNRRRSSWGKRNHTLSWGTCFSNLRYHRKFAWSCVIQELLHAAKCSPFLSFLKLRTASYRCFPSRQQFISRPPARWLQFAPYAPVCHYVFLDCVRELLNLAEVQKCADLTRVYCLCACALW